MKVMYFDDPRGRLVEAFAFVAEVALRRGDRTVACEAYAQAAEIETAIVRSIPRSEGRIRGVLAVSAAALWLKAGYVERAAEVTAEFISDKRLPAENREQLEELRCADPALADLNLAGTERRLITDALARTGSLIEAGNLLGVNRHVLRRLIAKHGIPWRPSQKKKRRQK